MERTVVRLYLASIVGVALAIVMVSSLATSWVVVRRDDGQAKALAMTMAAEFHNHRKEPPHELDLLIQHELEEQKWFQRSMEVWDGNKRIGGPIDTSLLQPWLSQQGCRLASLHGTWSRICTVHTETNTVVVVASPLAPLLIAQLPIVASITFAALLAVSVFAAIARRLVRRSLQSLSSFEQSVAALPALEQGHVSPSWGTAEIDQLAHTFNALLDRIQVAVQREQRFVSNAAHELRTPLTRLRGQIELVLQESQENNDSRRRLSLAVRSCEELSRSVDALLALSLNEIQASEAVDLGDVAAAEVSALEASQIARVEVCALSAVIRGDSALLALAVRNVLDNALKYSEGRVQIQVVENNDKCAIVINDTGHGIPEEELVLVREPFVRGKQGGGTTRGTGLGLALVEHVMQLHGGELVLVNTQEKLFQVVLRFPPWGAS
jgi:signal transduction histidine kinase